MPLAPGDKLGPYEILSPLGRGGMGEVFKARDTRLNREVAVKISAERFTERFEREARAIASLNHPNICTLFDVGPDYLVMEYIEGESPKGPLPLDQVLDIARQMADALDSAHERGITHRDLKPANLKITPGGKLKVLDFGLAKIGGTPRAESSGENSPTLTIGMTEVGMILGTAAYMAPEQAKGKQVDKRADIWAYGVVLYELSTGKRLFQGDDVTDTLASVLKETPDFHAAPERLRPLLKRCLEKDPKKRLRDIAEALPLLDVEPVVFAAPAKSSKLPFVVAASAAAVFALAAAAFAALWLRPAPLPQVTRFQINAPAGSRLPLGTPAISPDGRTIAYAVADEKGVTRIHVRGLDQTESRILPGTEEVMHPFFSPNGRSLAFASGGSLRRIDLDGGSPRVLSPITGPWHGDWGANGDLLFTNGAIYRLPSQGGTATEVQPIGGGHPYFFPDGSRYLFRGTGGIRLGTLNSKESSLILKDVDSAPALAPTPNGKLYLLYNQQGGLQYDLMAQELNPKSAALIGEPVAIVPSIGVVASPRVKPAFGVSSSGVLAYQTERASATGTLTWRDRTGKVLGTAGKPGFYENVHLSPDGALLSDTHNGDIWVTDLTRGTSTRLTYSGGVAVAVWSPDSKQLAYGRDGKLIAVNADGSGEKVLWETVALVRAWSEGGLFLREKDALFLHAGKNPDVPVGLPNSNNPAVAPGGKYFAFASSASGRAEVYLQPTPPGAGQTQISIEGGNNPRWRRDGKELFFVGSNRQVMAVDVTLEPKLSVGIPHLLFTSASPYGDAHPDGQRFLVVETGSVIEDNPITVVMNWWVDLQKK